MRTLFLARLEANEAPALILTLRVNHDILLLWVVAPSITTETSARDAAGEGHEEDEQTAHQGSF